MPVQYYGLGGSSYETIEEAWTDYFNELYDFESMPAEEYHDKYLLFVSGILSGMNIVSTRYNVMHRDQGVANGTAIRRAMLSLTNESMTVAAEEYRAAGRGKNKT